MGILDFLKIQSSPKRTEAPQEPKDERKAECPNCHEVLSKVPGAKTKCPHCGEFMFVRTKISGVRVVITKEEADKIDEAWRIENGAQEEYDTKQKTLDDELPLQCPYCHKDIDPKNQRKRKCITCGKAILIRNLPNKDGRKEYVTKRQALKIDAMNMLAVHGVNYQDFEVTKEKLSKQFKQVANDSDVLWSLMNQTVLDKSQDFREVSSIYFLMSWFLRQTGKDNFQVISEAQKWHLRELEKNWAEHSFKVSIETGGKYACENCRKFEGQSFTVKQALDLMPLPCKECLSEKGKREHGYCVCLYKVELDK